MTVGGLVRGARVPVLEPLRSRVVLGAPTVVVAGACEGAGAGELAARIVRALVALGHAPHALVVSARAREGVEVGEHDAAVADSEVARLLRAAGAGEVRWLRAHPASAEGALRALAGTLDPDRPLVVEGALALAVLAPRLSVLVTGRATGRPDAQARAVEPLFTLAVPDASDSLVEGLARLLST